MASKTEESTEPIDETRPEPEGFDPLDLDAHGWKPEAGAKLWGYVVKVESVPSEFYDPNVGGSNATYPLVQVLTDDGELVNVHCFHSVMRSFVENSRPAHGDRMGVKYKGRKLEGGRLGTGYEDYNAILVPADRLAISERPRFALPDGSA
jgi:hypothetical protein